MGMISNVSCKYEDRWKKSSTYFNQKKAGEMKICSIHFTFSHKREQINVGVTPVQGTEPKVLPAVGSCILNQEWHTEIGVYGAIRVLDNNTTAYSLLPSPHYSRGIIGFTHRGPWTLASFLFPCSSEYLPLLLQWCLMMWKVWIRR